MARYGENFWFFDAIIDEFLVETLGDQFEHLLVGMPGHLGVRINVATCGHGSQMKAVLVCSIEEAV